MKIEQLDRYISPLKRRVMQMVSRCVINLIDPARQLQKFQVNLLADEVHSNVDHVQQYGFTSAPLPGAEGVFLSVGGSREHGVVVAVDDRRYRLKTLALGEVALYTDEGDTIIFKRGSQLELTSLAKVQVTAPEVQVDGATKVTINGGIVEVNADTLVEVNCATANVTATTSATLVSPAVSITATTGITATTPLLNVTGLISCAGIGVGATPVTGQSNLVGNLNVTSGDITTDQDVADGVGTLSGLRGAYNVHTHTETGGTTSGPTPTA